MASEIMRSLLENNEKLIAKYKELIAGYENRVSELDDQFTIVMDENSRLKFINNKFQQYNKVKGPNKKVKYFQCKDWEASYPLDHSHKRTESFNFDCNAFIKIWVIDGLTIRSNNKPNLTSSLVPKLYRCDAGLINIYNQIISFDDLKYFMDLPLVNGLRQLRIEKVEISPMVEEASTLLQMFLQNISNVLSFQYTFGEINSNYQYFMLQRSKVPKVKKFPQDFIEYNINAIPNNFDIEFFIDFIKENPDINLSLNFCTDISDEYKERLENFVEAILKEYHIHKFYPPIIKFNEQNVKKVCELMHFRKSYATSRQTMEFKNEFAERVQFLRRR